MNLLGITYFIQLLWTAPVILFSKATHGSNTTQFAVHSLPGSPILPANWAGRLPVPGLERGNSLFFWLFQTEDTHYDDNLIRKFCLKM